MNRIRIYVPLVVVFLVLLLGACNTATTPPNNPTTTSDPVVQMVPDPTDPTTSAFPVVDGLDDNFVEVPFTRGFTFTFYGTAYDSVWINTNGGVTFGGGSKLWFEAADSIATFPGIAILWGDLDPSQGDPANPDQINYQQFDDRFVITYTEVAEYVDATKHNSMTLTLYANGKVTMSYDLQDTNHGIVGVFDGSGATPGYVNVALATTYDNYSADTGTIVYDPDGPDPTDRPSANSLEGMTLTFNP